MKYLFSLIVLFAIGCDSTQSHIENVQSQTVNEHENKGKKLQARKAASFPSINERLEIAQLKPLEKSDLNESEMEIRVWVGFGLFLIRGIVLRKGEEDKAYYLPQHPMKPKDIPLITSDEQTNVIKLAQNDSSKKKYKKIVELNEPKSGWENLWRQLNEQDITSLPDATEIGIKSDSLDGESIVVEIKTKHSYRTYSYPTEELYLAADNPYRKEVEQASNICKILQVQFDVMLLSK